MPRPRRSRRPLASMYALGPAGLPPTVTSDDGTPYTLEQTIKHDFWAATGFYVRAGDAGSPASPPRVVVKINRRTPLMGLPLRWTGRILRNREVRAYAKLQDVPNIPRLMGDATDTGFIHAYVEGAPLSRDRPVPDGFFDELKALVDELGRRGLAYVDTNKPENILLGHDGRPYLIDFQISFDATRWWPRPLGRWLLKHFHRSDVYHVLKQKRRFRPDQLTPAERRTVEHRAWPIRLHRTLTKPYFMVRRPLLEWMRRSGRIDEKLSD